MVLSENRAYPIPSFGLCVYIYIIFNNICIHIHIIYIYICIHILLYIYIYHCYIILYHKIPIEIEMP